MPNYEDELAKYTFKGDAETTQQRVFHTLTAGLAPALGDSTPVHLENGIIRTAKAVAHVLAVLHARGLVTAEELDGILYHAAGFTPPKST